MALSHLQRDIKTQSHDKVFGAGICVFICMWSYSPPPSHSPALLERSLKFRSLKSQLKGLKAQYYFNHIHFYFKYLENQIWFESILIWLLFSFPQTVLHDQCLELRSQVISLRSQLDTSQAVQRDFVQLSQSLQVHKPNICSFGQVFTYSIVSFLLGSFLGDYKQTCKFLRKCLANTN